jgi:hypothetical protein
MTENKNIIPFPSDPEVAKKTKEKLRKAIELSRSIFKDFGIGGSDEEIKNLSITLLALSNNLKCIDGVSNAAEEIKNIIKTFVPPKKSLYAGRQIEYYKKSPTTCYHCGKLFLESKSSIQVRCLASDYYRTIILHFHVPCWEFIAGSDYEIVDVAGKRIT